MITNVRPLPPFGITGKVCLQSVARRRVRPPNNLSTPRTSQRVLSSASNMNLLPIPTSLTMRIFAIFIN